MSLKRCAEALMFKLTAFTSARLPYYGGGCHVLSDNQLATSGSIHSQSLFSWLVRQRADMEAPHACIMLIVNLLRYYCRGRSVGQGSAASQHSVPQHPAAHLLADGGGWPGCELSGIRAVKAVPTARREAPASCWQLQSATRCCSAQAPPNPPRHALKPLNAQPSGQPLPVQLLPSAAQWGAWQPSASCLCPICCAMPFDHTDTAHP